VVENWTLNPRSRVQIPPASVEMGKKHAQIIWVNKVQLKVRRHDTQHNDTLQIRLKFKTEQALI
jgi:hypothetical protein